MKGLSTVIMTWGGEMSGAGVEGGHSVDCQDSPLAWRESLGKGQTSDALESLTQVVKIFYCGYYYILYCQAWS